MQQVPIHVLTRPWVAQFQHGDNFWYFQTIAYNLNVDHLVRSICITVFVQDVPMLRSQVMMVNSGFSVHICNDHECEKGKWIGVESAIIISPCIQMNWCKWHNQSQAVSKGSPQWSSYVHGAPSEFSQKVQGQRVQSPTLPLPTISL